MADLSDPLSPDGDPPHFSVHQKGPVAIDRLAETHQNALVIGKIIGMLRTPFISQ